MASRYVLAKLVEGRHRRIPVYAASFIQYFIQVHHLVGHHRPRRQLRHGHFRVRFRFADRDEFFGVVGLGRVVLFKLFERAAHDRQFFWPQRPREQPLCYEIESAIRGIARLNGPRCRGGAPLR